MAKRGPLDSFFMSGKVRNDSENVMTADADSNVPSTSKRFRTFQRQYDVSYIQFGFTVLDGEEIPKPQYIICSAVLSNDAMKPSKLKRHLNTMHKELSSKPIEFFQRKLVGLKSQQKQIYELSHINTAALRASYKIAFRIAKAKKPYTIEETLVSSCIQDACLEILGEQAVKKVALIPLSNDTIARRISDISQDMEEQLINQIKTAKYYALQLDESTDVAGEAILLVYVRYEFDGDLKEEFLFSASLETNTTSAAIFEILQKYVNNKYELDFRFCVGVCTDGAAAMTGRNSGVVKQINNLAPYCKSTHCFIHRENLATKKLSPDLNEILTEVVKIVNFVTANALNSRLFVAMCNEMDGEHTRLLLHAEVRWLSRGKVLSRIFELRTELAEFLQNSKPNWSQLFLDVHWVAKLAYLADLFAIFNDLNVSMQGSMHSCFSIADKIDAQKRKLEAWKNRVSRNCYDMFHNLSTIIDEAGKELNIMAVKKNHK